MTKWNTFTPSRIEYDFEADKLAAHGITYEEAAQCFLNEYLVAKNKKRNRSFKLIGTTHGGRKLCIIFELKPARVVRIITGWDT